VYFISNFSKERQNVKLSFKTPLRARELTINQPSKKHH
jgi:hypothetical protein